MCEVEKQFVLLLGCEADWGREKEEAKPTFPLQFLLGICVKWDCVHWRCFSVRLRWIKSSSLTRSSPTPSRQHKQRDLWTASCLASVHWWHKHTHHPLPALLVYHFIRFFVDSLFFVFFIVLFILDTHLHRDQKTHRSLLYVRTILATRVDFDSGSVRPF